MSTLASAFRRSSTWLLLLSAALLFSGCDALKKQAREQYYSYLEDVGFEKRDLLVKRVDRARDAQEDAQEEFEDALEQFQALVGHEGGELEAVYNKLKGKFDDAESRAEKVNERIRKVENVAEALFEEWQTEIGELKNADYRRQSESSLRDTKSRYTQLVGKMKQAASTMDPVLAKLRDQVLFLKHNLNAQALGSLEGEATNLEADVSQLIVEMQASIAEADSFIRDMTKKPAQS
ncbi:MAG: DUF2959 domain-containing protein [Acidobacteriota bacterium]